MSLLKFRRWLIMLLAGKDTIIINHTFTSENISFSGNGLVANCNITIRPPIRVMLTISRRIKLYINGQEHINVHNNKKSKPRTIAFTRG